MREEVIEIFKNQFGQEQQLLIRAPGRINLIGEHTDYNMGCVLPAAINKNIYLAFSRSQAEVFSLYSSQSEELVISKPGKLVFTQPSWANYLTGIIDLLVKDGHTLHGFNLAFSGDIPQGAGLSSSAALCCGFIYGLNILHQLHLTNEKMALYAQQAEHLYAGVKCGLMDQYAVLLGKEGYFLKLDCRSMAAEYIPANLDGYSILLCDSGIKHNLAESGYNERREECEEGVDQLREFYPEIRSLRDVSRDMLGDQEKELRANVFKRCKFIIEENQRQEEVCISLREGNMMKTGTLLYTTHMGLKNDFEVSCPELDFLVETAMKMNSVTGARMIGGGFGGCSINLVQKNKTKSTAAELTEKYENTFGKTPAFYEIKITNGISIA